MVEVVYTDEFERWFGGLSDQDAEAVAQAVDVLESVGLGLGSPRSSQIKGSKFALRELRVQSGGRPVRVFYAFDPKRRAVLLIGGDKTGNDRFYDQMNPIADRIFEEYLAELAREEAKRGGSNMRTNRWAELKARRFSPGKVAEIRRRADEEIIEMNLRTLRESCGKTQEELAAAAEMNQAQLSKFERRDDHLISKVRSYVEALGGELEVVAVVGDKRVKIVGV